MQRRIGRVVECGGLENHCTARYRGFESLILRQSPRNGAFLYLIASMETEGKSYQTESHLRSVIKGFTWRIIAFVDTMVMTLLVTWIFDGEPHIEAGLTIAAIEFFVKIAIYYGHERAWQIAWKDGVFTPKETLFKTATWRIIATLTTFIISGKVLGSFAGAALGITLAESVTKFIFFYLHERLWLRIPLGTVRKIVPLKNKSQD